MSPRLLPLLDVPIAFAHRGARILAPENTMEAFRLALRLGATGLESDVWLTADGIAVLDHDGVVRTRFRKQPIAGLARADIPGFMPTLDEVYAVVGASVPLSLDVKDPEAFEETVGAARRVGAEEQLWICHPDLELLMAWRRATSAHLVHSSRLRRLKGGPERHASQLRDAGIDAVNFRHNDWSGGLIALYHRFERFTLGWDAQHPREIANLLDAGIDGLFSDHPDRLSEALRQYFGDVAR